MDYEERVRRSYWNRTYVNGTVREKKIAAFLQRCSDECLPMDRPTALALSEEDMAAFAARHLAHPAESARIARVVRDAIARHMDALLRDLQTTLPTHHLMLRVTLRDGLCVETDGRSYPLSTIAMRHLASKL